MYEKIVVVTRQTRLQELIARFNTRAQAQFYIEHSGGNFAEYDLEDQAYTQALQAIKKQLHFDLKLQYIDRGFLPNYVFAPSDLIVVVGQDGLVANTAKYVGSQPIIGVNPDPARFDGILVPNKVQELRECVQKVFETKATIRQVTLAEAQLNDGQKLLAFNDLFIGARTHVSARYQLQYHNQKENQSSSGIIVSTGAGSTGWLSSIFNMVSSVQQFLGGNAPERVHINWDSPQLMFVVREPFVSKHSTAGIVTGFVQQGDELIIESRMPTEGAIFSDGIESDFIPFNAGAIARIRTAAHRAQLVLAHDTAQPQLRPSSPTQRSERTRGALAHTLLRAHACA